MPQDSLPEGPIRVLRGAELVLPDRTLAGDLLVQGTRIHSLAAAGEGKGAEVFELPGHRVMPGFIDLHTHGGWGVDFARGDAADYQRAAIAYGRAGVTRLLPTLVPAPWEEMLDRLADAASWIESEPAYLGIHLEGPFLSPHRRGALPESTFVEYTDDRMQELLDASAGALRVMTFAPEVVPVDRIARIQSRGVMLSIGHTDATREQTAAAIRAGARRVTHVCNAMPSLHHRNPGPLLPILEDAHVRCEVIADGEHLDDAILGHIMKVKAPEAVVAVSDSMPLTGTGPGRAEFAGVAVTSDGCRATQADGTLAGSVTDLPSALLRLEREMGLPPWRIAELGASNPAKDLRLPRVGRIALGHRADLVIFGPNGAAVATFRGGQRVGAEDGEPFLTEDLVG